ncbi:PD40 domain-containing protein [Stenotrophomonas sp. Sa5BUN4]|uniref:PD40 domain-containing protein n=1 Tax=Stenotrophomonas lacuserhaii TaxID=2760084 RepID=A0A8X8FWF0_9GAMM|nr:PD40 domain-containing protein [Stenotrophomonas pennii]MBD7955056.1 PD40 domain-containing protein [Stenotrophomonas pennii]
MNTQILINNLKFLKRSVRESPDIIRNVLAHMRGPTNIWPDPAATRESPARAYRLAEDLIPVHVVTPPDGHYMTTFFDVNPFSPSGRYLAVTQVPFINRIPIPGDRARVCVIDLDEGRCDVIHETAGWGAQLGANVHWGQTDDLLFCNDVINGRATGVRLSRNAGLDQVLDGPVYGMSPDARYSYAPNIEYVNAIIPGYGVADPLLNKPRQREKASRTEGIWRTDLATGRKALLISLHDIVLALGDQSELAGGSYYVFNVKVNPSNDRLFAVIFSTGVPLRAGTPVQLITMRLDGSDVRLAMPDRLWRVGGHHPNWTPDGEHILMNLRPKGEQMAFVQFRSDGSELSIVAPGHKGSGHPSIDCSGRYLLTDSYTVEGFKNERNDVPLRLIDLEKNEERHVTWVHTKDLLGPRRIDPHPVWAPDGKRFAFNGTVNGYRQVMIGDTRGLPSNG